MGVCDLIKVSIEIEGSVIRQGVCQHLDPGSWVSHFWTSNVCILHFVPVVPCQEGLLSREYSVEEVYDSLWQAQGSLPWLWVNLVSRRFFQLMNEGWKTISAQEDELGVFLAWMMYGSHLTSSCRLVGHRKCNIKRSPLRIRRTKRLGGKRGWRWEELLQWEEFELLRLPCLSLAEKSHEDH